MKSKHGILLFIAGFFISIVGAWLKIVHWDNSNIFLLIGGLIETAGIALLIYKVLTYDKFKDFLNK